MNTYYRTAQLVPLFQRMLERCKVNADETVLVVTDPDTNQEYAAAMFAAMYSTQTILPVLLQEFSDHMGGPWEAAFHLHLTRLAIQGRFGPEVVAIGAWWSADSQTEIDAVVLAGRGRTATHLGEAKWARTVDGGRIVAALQRKAGALPKVADQPEYIVCAREAVAPHHDVALAITAADIFGA